MKKQIHSSLCAPKKKKKKKQQIHMSSRTYEESGYILDLDLLTPSHS